MKDKKEKEENKNHKIELKKGIEEEAQEKIREEAEAETKETEEQETKNPLHDQKTKTIIGLSLGLFFLLSGIVAANSLFARYSFGKLHKTALTELENGNYSTALVLYNKLQDKSPENVEISSELTNTQNLLVAEQNYLKAQEAAQNEEWLVVEILLENSEAIANEEFKFYLKALELYKQAQSQVDSFEKEVSDKISSLKQTIKEGEERASALESQNQQTENQLNQTVSQKQQLEQNLNSTAQALQATQQELDQAAQAKAQLEAEKRELELQKQKEILEKFRNELNVYVDMIKKGNGYLNDAISEINKSVYGIATYYIGLAENSFDDIREKIEDLRVNRTPEGFIADPDTLLNSLNLFDRSVDNFKVAAAKIGGGEEFDNAFNEAKDLKTQAYQLMHSVEQTLAGY